MNQFLTRVRETYDRGVAALTDKSKPYYIQNLLAALIVSFFAVTALFMMTGYFSGQPAFTSYEAYIGALDTLMFLLAVAALTAVLILAMCLSGAEKILPMALVVSVTVFCSFLQNGTQRNIWLSVGIGLVCYLACLWIFNRFEAPFSSLKPGFGMVKIIVSVMFVLFVGALSFMSICRLRSFTYDTFDFGIFMQMFDYMKETGLPLTTVERNTELSHFAVHFSPFFYVLLPGYWLFPTPEYLCVMQVAFVGVGVFAVYGIAKHLQFSPKATLLLCTLYLSYPSLSFGLFFDFHENKFLTFCILFAIYFLLKRKMIPFYIFAVLLCSVKEDAAMYLMMIAVFMIIHERMIKHGVLTLLLAAGYFLFALEMIQICGASEAMEFGYRYDNFALDGEAGVGQLVKVTLFDLGYSLTQIFTLEKVEFMLWMFLPVMFTPFMTKKISTLVLVAPMLVINLMSLWPYQFDVDYQYTFGTAALVIAAAILALRRLSPKKRNLLLTAAVMTCLAVTLPRVTARSNSYINGYFANQAMFDSSIAFIDETLSKDSVIGVEGNVMPLMHDYPHLVLDPHSDELAARMEYYIAKLEDGDLPMTVDRAETSLLPDLEPVADNGYLAVYKNPAYPIYEETQQFIESVIPKDAAVGTRNGAENFMPYTYKHVSPNPHYDDLLMDAEYLVTKAGDYMEAEFTSRGYEFVGEKGYVAIFRNPDYAAFMTTVRFAEQEVPSDVPVGVRGNVRRYLSAAYKDVHHDLPMEHLSSSVQYYVAKVGEVADEELTAVGFVKQAENGLLVIYRNTTDLSAAAASGGSSSMLTALLLVAAAAVAVAGVLVLRKRKTKRKAVPVVEASEADTETDVQVEETAVEETVFEEAKATERKKLLEELFADTDIDVSGDDL